jgi:hypothetical protein
MIAAAALALTIALPGEQAEAKTKVDINVGIGFGGYIGPGYGYVGTGYDHDYTPDHVSCSQARKVVRWNGFKAIKALDCSAPSYKFSGWKSDKKFSIRVNSWGDITGVKSY